jgi:hypothetical protein
MTPQGYAVGSSISLPPVNQSLGDVFITRVAPRSILPSFSINDVSIDIYALAACAGGAVRCPSLNSKRIRVLDSSHPRLTSCSLRQAIELPSKRYVRCSKTITLLCILIPPIVPLKSFASLLHQLNLEDCLHSVAQLAPLALRTCKLPFAGTTLCLLRLSPS